MIGLCVKTRIYHNPRCSKSRATLALLEKRGTDLEIVEYLKTPPDRGKLESLLGKLGLPVRDIVRFEEAAFRESGLTRDASADALIELLVREPRLLQRPIVEHGSKARIGRPPEQVLELFE
jgi:arsenate reductase